ncbi:hypothetical protein HDU81_008769 [Chytriomyces hyalinus]|nr:hypothetical protein HDU81_008769 [Chytriomyces hyalinus]
MSSSEPLPQRSLSTNREQDIQKLVAEVGARSVPAHLLEASSDALSESIPVIAAASRSKSVVLDCFRRNSSHTTSVTAADDTMERRQSMNLNRFISKVNTVYDMEKIVPSTNGFAEYLANETSSDEEDCAEEETNTPMALMGMTSKSKRQSLSYNSDAVPESPTPQARRQSISRAAASKSRQTSIIKSAVADDVDAVPTSSSLSSLRLNFLRRMSAIATSLLPSFANNPVPSDPSANAPVASKTSPNKEEDVETIIDMPSHTDSPINTTLPPLPQKRNSLNALLFNERPTAPKVLPPLAPPVFTLSHAKFAEDDQIPAMVPAPVAQPEQKNSRRASLTIPKSLYVRTDSDKQPSASNSNSEARLSTCSQRNTTTQRHARTIYLGGNVATPVTNHQAMSMASPVLSRSSVFLNTNPIPLSPTQTQQKRRSVSGLTIPSPNSIMVDRRRSASTGIVIPSTPSRIQVAVAAGENVIPLLKSPDAPENEPLSEAALMYLDAFSILRSQATASTPTERRPAMKPDRVEETKLDSFGKVVRIASEMKQAGVEPSVAAELDKDTLTMVLKLKKWARQKRRNKDHNVHEFLNIKKFNAEVETQLPMHLQIDLIQDVLPIVTGYARMYATQLGQGHGFTAGAAKHLQRLTERYEKGCCTKGTGE